MAGTKKFIMSLVQNKVIKDKDWNLKRAEELMTVAVEKFKPNVIALPEFFNTPLFTSGGNPYDYAEFKEDSLTIKMLSDFARKHKIYLIGGSIPIKVDDPSKKVFNTSFSFDINGDIKATYRKMHLFDIDIPGKIYYKESDKVIPGNREDLLTVFETPFAKFGIGICYDLRFYEHAHLLKSEKNVDCIVYPSAFSLPTGTMHWDILRKSRALDNNVFIAMVSPSRNTEDLNYFQVYGHSSFVDPYGTVINTAGYEETIVTSEIDLQVKSNIEAQIPTWKHKRSDLYTVKRVQH